MGDRPSTLRYYGIALTSGCAMSTLVHLLPAVFGLSIAIALLIYWYGGRISHEATSEDIEAKRSLYACGEDFPTEDIQIEMRYFYIFGVYLLIFDVLIFMLVISPPSAGFRPAIYSMVLLAAISLLVYSRRGS